MGMRTEKREKVKEREDLRVLSLKRVKERQTNIVSHGKQKRIYIYIYRSHEEESLFSEYFYWKTSNRK